MSTEWCSVGIQEHIVKYCKATEKVIQYGTSGFRGLSDSLDWIVYRMGLLSAIYSKFKGGSFVGVMITASHNQECDNGVKLISPTGDMMDVEWETLATRLVNVSDSVLAATLQEFVNEKGIDLSIQANVCSAYDTRPSSPRLSEALRCGVSCVSGSNFVSYGLLTTPQFHYIIRCINTKGAYGEPTLEGYYSKLSTAFNVLMGKCKAGKVRVAFDGAHGVGGIKVRELMPHVKDYISIDVHNDGTSPDGQLNYRCGADFVKVNQCIPDGMGTIVPGMRYVSVDGDVDRVVYFFTTPDDGVFHLLDGDKLACLLAGYLRELISEVDATLLDRLTFGLVQTAYANGASTHYMTEVMKVPVACVPTGVKHLHHRATQYDIGVYFEANGHGTVVFSEKAETLINECRSKSGEDSPADTLYWFVRLINQTVGDGLSDMLVIEYILACRGWTTEQWSDMYTDLPNRQLKVKVPNRRVFEVTDAERLLVKPEGLQSAIDACVGSMPGGSCRSFVRPSGTEEVVRVYAEADTQSVADQLADKVRQLVVDFTGA